MDTIQNHQVKEELPNPSIPTWVLLTRYFKYKNGKQEISSCLLRLESERIKETINRWENLFGHENDFLITYQIITAFDGANKPFLYREDANEQTIKQLLK